MKYFCETTGGLHYAVISDDAGKVLDRKVAIGTSGKSEKFAAMMLRDTASNGGWTDFNGSTTLPVEPAPAPAPKAKPAKKPAAKKPAAKPKAKK